MTGLAQKTIFISGGSRGIGLAIAVRAAQDGANVCLIAKTAEPDPRLPGTIYTAAKEIEAAGGRALPVVGDIRDEAAVLEAVQRCVELFGGIDICINNASAINLSGTENLPMKRYDLMQDINTRGTFVVTKCCIPHLKQAENPHVLTLSPPLSVKPNWFAGHVAYTIAKYGMSMCTLGMAEEFRSDGVAFNSLWPRTTIATAAVRNLLGGDDLTVTLNETATSTATVSGVDPLRGALGWPSGPFASWQAIVPVSVKVLPASGTNCQSQPAGRSVSLRTP